MAETSRSLFPVCAAAFILLPWLLEHNSRILDWRGGGRYDNRAHSLYDCAGSIVDGARAGSGGAPVTLGAPLASTSCVVLAPQAEAVFEPLRDHGCDLEVVLLQQPHVAVPVAADALQ